MKTSSGMRIFLVTTIVSFVVAFGCDDHEGITIGETSFTVSGKVTDSVTDQPIDSVLVSWGDTLLRTIGEYTDTAGQFRLHVPQSGHVVWVRKEGYVSKDRGIVGINSDLTNFDFELKTQ